MKPNAPISARAQAAQLLERILTDKRTLDEAIAQSPLRGSESDIKFTRALLLTTLRHLGQLDAVIAKYLLKPLPPKRRAISNALRLGATQLLLLDTPAHAAVNETVTLIRKGKDAGLAGLVNAVLQKIAREKPALPLPTANLPISVAERWQKFYGLETVQHIAILAATRAPLDLTTAIDMEGAIRLDAYTIRLPADHAPVESLPGYNEGTFFVQDIAASYPARLLGDVTGKRVLDICAAPGGKAAQLARAGAHVTALDRSPARMQTLAENMARLNCAVESVTADALTWNPTELYDAILLDAPCSATGTWRRHPEVVHIVTAADIAELTDLQRQLLTRAWDWLKPGGKLVYCVCSLEREEGEAQAEWFLSQQKNAAAIPIAASTEIPSEAIKGNHLRTTPALLANKGGMDGFFAVGFVKA